MPFDPTLSTNPDLRKQAAPQIAAQKNHEREVLQYQREQQRAEETAQREADKIQRETAKQVQQQANIAAETNYQATGRAFFTDAAGNIVPKVDDATHEAQQAAAKQRADQEIKYKQEGRKFTKNALTGDLVPLESDAILEQRRIKEADDLRRESITQQMKSISAEGALRANPLRDKDRAKLEKELKTAHDTARFSLAPKLQEQAKAVTGGNDYIPFNESPAPQAESAKARLERLMQPDAKLDDTDLADLEADPATAPSVAQLRTLKDKLSADDEARSIRDQTSQTLKEMALRRADPVKYEAMQREKLAKLDGPALDAHLATGDEALKTRAADLETRAQALQQPSLQWQQKRGELEQQNAQAKANGIPAGELVTLSDGSAWHAPLAKQLFDIQAQQQAHEGDPEVAKQHKLHEIDVAEFNRDAKLLNEAAQLRQKKGQETAQVQSDVRRFTPGFEKAAGAIDAIQQEGSARVATVAEMYPQDGPERQAAMKAIEQDVTTRAEQASAEGQQTQAAVSAAYQGIKQRLAENPKLNAVAGDLFLAARKNLSQALGISEAEANKLLDDAESQDWSTTQGKHGETIPTGNAAQRFMTEAAGDKRQFRLLQNGGVIINPVITDPEAYRKAVEAAPASPEAKAAAISRQPDLRAQYGKQALETLTQIGDSEWAKFQAAQPKDVSQEEIAARYADKLKAETSTSGKVLRAIFQSMAQGVDDIGAQALGLGAGMSGSETLMKGATALNERSQLIEADKQMRGAGGNFALDTAGQFSRLLPSLIPAAGGARAAQVGLALFARTGIAARLLPGLVSGLKAASTPAQAAKAAASFTRAGVAGASLAGGAQTYGAQIADIYTTLRNEHPEMDHSTALRQAQVPAILSGAMTSILTVAGGATGVEKLIANPAAVKEAFKKQFASRLAQAGFIGKAVLAGGAKEWPEEIADEVFSQIAAAVGTGHSVPQALAQFAESLPELSAAILMLGGLGEGTQAFRESSYQPAAAPADNSQTAPTAPAPIPPELTAAAWAAIENLDLPGVDPAQVEPMQTRAAVALAVAQGGSVEDMEEAQLNAVGWTGRNSKGQTLPPGKIEKLKDYTGPEVLEVDTKGNATVAASYRASLEQHLPAVAAAIPLSPVPADSVQKPADSTGKPDNQQPRGSSAQGAAPAAVDAGGKPQAGAEAVSSAPAAGETANVPSSMFQAGTPEAERSAQLATHLATLGLTPEQAAPVADHVVEKQGVKGTSYLEQVIATDFPKILRDLGITGSLSPSQSQANPLRAPADLSQRMASQKPASAASTKTYDQMTDSELTARRQEIQVAQNDALAGMQPDPNFAASAKQALDAIDAEVAKRKQTAVSPPPATPATDVTPPVQTTSEKDTPPTKPGNIKAIPVKPGRKLTLVEEDRAQQLSARLAKSEDYTDEESVALAEEYVAQSAENHTPFWDQWRFGFLNWLARKETEARGGRLAKSTTATTRARAENLVTETPDRPADIRAHPAWARNRLAALSSLPAAQRPAARSFLNALERALAQNHALFSSLALGPKEIARTILGEGSMAVQEMDGHIILALDLGRILDQFKNTTTPAEGITAALVEEAIHAAVMRLAKKNPGKYGLPALVKRWQSLTPELRQKVWESYHAVDIQNGTHSKTIPSTMKDGQQWALMNEFLRMLVQDKAFAGQVSEVAAQDKGLAQWIVDALKDLAKALKDLISKASPEVQAELNMMVDEIALTVKLFQGFSAEQQFGAAPAVVKTTTSPPALTTTADNRAAVLSPTNEPSTEKQEVRGVVGSTGTAYTDANDAIEFQWAVVNVEDLNISNRDDGSISPEYPQELQPRDRTSAGSEAQVADIAKNFNLDRLSASSSVGDGAPITGPDGVVESGNGRVMGARRAYDTGNASSAAYRAALIARAGEFGLNAEQVEAVKKPVLVRIRTTKVNRIAFVLSANVSNIAPKRELEQAKIDAKQIVPDLFTAFVPNEEGEVFTAANAEFIRDFVSAIIPPAERPAIMDAKGNLSQSGLRRLRNALFVYAYGDSKDTLAALGTLTEDIEADGRNLVNTLIAIAPRFAEQNSRIAAGALYPLSITADLAKALTTYQDIKARGDTVDSWASQDTLAGIGEKPSDFERTLVTTLHEHRRKPRVLLASLDRYAKAIDGAGDPKQASLFGDEPRPTREELFALATGKTFTQEEAEGWRKLAEKPAAPITPPAATAVETAAKPEPTPPAPPKSLSTAEAAAMHQKRSGITDRDALAKLLEQRLSLRPFAAQSMAEAVLNDLAGNRVVPASRQGYTGPQSQRYIFGAKRMEGPGADAARARQQFEEQQRNNVPSNKRGEWIPEDEYLRAGGKKARPWQSLGMGAKKVWHSGSIQGDYDPRKADLDSLYGPGFYASTSKVRSEGYGKKPARPFIITAKKWFDHDGAISHEEARRIAAFLDAPEALDSLFQDEKESGTPIIGEDVWNALKDATSPLMANEALAAAGYDGATYTGNHGKERDYIVWQASQIQAATPALGMGTKAPLAPKSALRLYRTLTAKQQAAPLTPGQSMALEQAERSLGQTFLFDDPNTSILKPAEDLVLERQTASRATFADSSPVQMKLFMATKKALYSKAKKEKHLLPIVRMLVKLRAGVQDALVRTVAETVLPRLSPRIRALMDQANADYDAWLKPHMAALKPQWEAYKARYTPAIVDSYNEGLEALAKELGIMPMTRVPLKGDRGMEKAILDAKDEEVDGVMPTPDVTRVNDVLRASLVAANDEEVARAVAALRARYKVVRFKDRFTKPVGGYHDWNFIIEVAPGLNAEVQIHRIDYLFSKELGPGHLMYEDWRRLDRLVKMKNISYEVERHHRRLGKAMESYYTAIAQAFNISRNESSSISTPSLNSRVPSAIGRGTGDPRQVIGTGGDPSMSQVAGNPSTSKNFVVGENESGIFTPESTTQTPNKQGVTITSENIAAYAGTVDVSALQGRQKDWKQAFDWQPGGPLVPLSKLVSHKNELEDTKFKAGLKKDPLQNAADWILKAMQGEPGAKKRAPLDVSANPDGTFTIQDGNATAQALMLAGWKAVPVNVVQASTDSIGDPVSGAGNFLPALHKGRTAATTDAAYRAAVTDNDTDRMRAIITARAADEGYDAAQEWHHGTDADFNVFDGNKTFGGNGLHWFANFRPAAESFTKAWRTGSATTSRVIDAYVNRGNTLDLNTPEGVKLLEELVARFPNERIPQGWNVEKNDELWAPLKDPRIAAAVQAAGYDSILLRRRNPVQYNWNDPENIETLALFDSARIKSAALVTYDPDGKVIPPSQRFDAASPNILYKGTTAVNDGPDLFSFNTGLGLDALLTPAQKETKLNNSQQLSLFDELGPRTNAGAQRTEKTRRVPRQGGAARQPEGADNLFGDLFSERDDGQRISAARLPGKRGSGDNGTGSGDIGDGVLGPTDQGAKDGPADSVQGDPPGLSLAPAVIPQPADPADRNHRINGSGTVAPKGGKAKLEANFAAMKLVRELDAEGRNPTPEEKQILAAYTGWGWMKEAFNTVRARKYEDLKRAAERYIANKPRYDSRYFAKWQDYYAAGNVTEEDQRILNWADTYLETHERLKSELSEKEFHAAEKSTLNAHFTTPSIIDAMWKAVAKLGFKGGRAMEPGGGIGHFIGVQPDDLANRTQWEATELDDVTARILARLYPQARVNSAMSSPKREVSGMGFQNARIPNNSLDLFISNVPFAKTGPGKSKSEFGQDFNLHNYFFARALAKVKPGGLIAFITTSNTMESSRAQRDYMNNHGQLVAAVRLPNNAFKENAGTEVTTDIIILRKPDNSDFIGEPWRERIKVGEDTVTSKRGKIGPSLSQKIDDWLGSIDPEWIPADEALVAPFQAWMKGGRPASGQKRNALITALQLTHGFNVQKLDFRAPIYVNEYFARHPENVLGTNRLIGSMYGPGEYTVLPKEEALDTQLDQFVDRLPADIMNQTATDSFEAKAAERGDKVDSYVERDGLIYQVAKEGLEPVEWQIMPGMDAKAKSAAERKTAIFRQWAKVREAAVALVKLEANPLADETEMKAARALLNQVYDRTVEKYGALSKRRNNNYRFLEDDPEAALLAALEDEERSTDKDGKVTYTYTKTDIFRRRLIEPQEAPTKASSLEEAVSISMAWEGTVNPQYVADLLGTDAGLARQQLIEGGHAFEDPTSGMLMTADEYLSGPVSERLRLAQEAVKDSPQYARNVTALREALPPHKAISEASVILGQRWIPDSIYTAFARSMGIEDGTVEFSKELNSFDVRGDGSNEEWNVGTQGAKDILDAVVNNSTLVYRRYVRGEGMQVDEELTATLRLKADEMRDAFSTFVKTTEEQVPDTEFEGQQIIIPDLAEREFNQKVNGIKPPEYVGDWIKLPGQSGIIWLKPFRKAVLARLITQGRGMMAHGVGSGKTYNQIALAMELRRLGKARKPVIVVQNSTINQFAASFRKAYPQAKILVATPRSYNAKTRARFTARMATGDWDAIIMTHSNVDLIGHSEETVSAYFAKELEELDAAIMSSDGSDQQSDLQKARDSLIEKRDEMMQALGERQDDTLHWEDIGVDALIVDEAHAFKNAPVVTNRGRDIKNIPSSGVGSQRAVSMMMKTRSVRERNNQRGVFFATGTPVSNSMAEAFIMLRYIAPDMLEANGIRNFDDFASQYGDVVSQAESTWDGKVKMVDRFAKFVNGQQLINLVRSVFDVAMGNESLGIDVPTVKGGKPRQVVVPATPANISFNNWILQEVSPAWERISRKDIKENPKLSAVPIMTMQAGIAAALDPRLIHDNAPDDPNSKVNTAIREVLRTYKAGSDRKTAQVIFSDLFNSFNMDILEGFAGHPFADLGENPIRKGGKVRDDGSLPRGNFNLGADIKAKLIAAGVPEKEIMVVTDQKDEALTNIFDKVNDGDIRVIIGSTGRLGVGVNIQERLAAVHHLMPPRDFKPAMMEQRNGRIIRQGNLHAEWRDIALVDVVERLGKTRLPTKDDEGKALSPAKRAEEANKWMAENDKDGSIKTAAEEAAREFDIEITEYGVEKSLDSAVYSMMAAKQGMIAQVLTADAVGNEFEDPSDEIRMNMAEMAAHTMGDPDMIRTVTVDKIFRELRAAYEGFQRMDSSRRSDVRRLTHNITTDTASLPRIDSEAARYGNLWEANEGNAVYNFGGTTIDTSEKDAKITKPLDLWVSENAGDMALKGQEERTAKFTVNGQDFNLTVKGESEPTESNDGGVFGFVEIAKSDRYANFQGGARGVLQALHRLTEWAATRPAETRATIAKDSKKLSQIEAFLAKEQGFPRMEELQAIMRERQELMQRINARNAPAPKPASDNTVRQGLVIPPLAQVDPDLLTPTVQAVLAQAVITDNSLVLPEQLDRKVYEKVNKALESAGGVWSKRDKAHLFAGDPRPYLGLAPMPEGTPTLAMSTKAVYSPDNEATNRLDRRTAHPSRITGARVTAEQGQALRNDHFARLLTGALRPDSPAARSNFDWSPGPGLAALLSEAFSAPILTPAQQAAIHALPINDEGVESMIYLDRANGVIYKKLKNYAEAPSGGIWPQVTWAGRSLSWHLQPANNPRAVGVRLAVMTDLGGTPTEVAAIGPEGHIYLKQPLSSAPKIATEQGSHITVGTRHLAGLVEIPDKHLEPGSARAWIGIVNGRPWLVTDLHPDNFIGDNQGAARINDPVIGVISMNVLKNVPGLGAVVQEASRRAQELGDRANRLFMSNKAVADSSKSGDNIADDLSQRPTSDTRANSANSPEFIARIVLGADRRGRQKEPPSKTLQGNRTAIAEEYKRLTDWAREQGLIFEPSQLGGELDSRGEHRVYYVKGAKRLYKVTHPNLSGLTRRALELRDGTVRVMEDDALPSEYFDRWALHNEMLDDDTRFEGILENAAGQSIVISQPYIHGSHPDASPDLTLAGWTQEKGYWTKPHPKEPGLLIGLADTKPSNWIQDSATKAVLSVDTIPFIVTNAMRGNDVTPPLHKGTTAPSPLAALGWNHLDRSLSGKLAALTRWTNETTKAGELVAKWQGAPVAAPFMKAAHLIKKELFPDSILPREIAAAKREMEIKTAMGGQRAMDLVRALSGSPKFSDIAYPPEFAANPIWRQRLYTAMTGETPMTNLPAPLQALAAKLRTMLVEIGQEAVKQGRMSLDTFEMLREGYMPHFYKEDVQREKSLIQRFRLAVRDLLGARTGAWHIVDTQNRERGSGDFRAVEWQPGKWRFRNKEHRDAHYEDFILSQALSQVQAMGGKNRSLTVADLRAPAALTAETRGALDVIKRQLRQRYQKEAPLSIEAHQKAGLIMDPVYAIARYAAQQAHDNSTAEFFNFVAANPDYISDVATAGFTEVPDNPRYGRLAGKYVTDDVAHQILEMIEAPGDALRAYDTVLGWWKTGKTVLNPGTHVRNVLGNVFFSQLAGNSVWNPGNTKYYRDALRAMRNGGPDLMEAYEQGVLGADFVSVELRQTLRQLLPDPATIEEGKPILGIGKSIGHFTAKIIGNPAHKAYNQIAALYQAEDEIFKLAAYLKAKDMLTDATKAAAHVRHWFPYFDAGSSTTLRALGRTAMPFLGFYRESIRIFGHALSERPLALVTGLAVPSIITALSAMALGLDDDELEQVKKDMRGKGGKLLGPTPLGGVPLFSMLLPVRSDQGQVQQFDISAIHPFVDHLGNRVEGGEGEDWYQKAWRSFIAAGPIGSLIYSQMTGKDAFGDRQFVEPNMSTGEKLTARADNLAKTLLPPLVPGGTSFQSLMKAGERQTNKTFETRSPTQTVLRSVVGLDVRNATPNLYRMAEDWRKANGYEVQEGMDYGSTTPASRARAALFAQIAQDTPNETAIANIKKRLAEMGHPIRSEQDVNRLLFYRDPLKVIGGDSKRGISAKAAQQQFQASLNGQDRATLTAAQAEYQKIKARAPMLLLR